MARIRTIKPQHWSDKELPKISLQAHLLWIAMWNFSDDAGVIEDDPLLLRSNIFPRRTDIRTEQISQWLDQLVKARFIIPFTFENDGYYLHRTFGTHQKIDRPQASVVPSDIIRRLLDDGSTNDQPCIVEYSSVEESKGGVKEKKIKTPSPTDHSVVLKSIDILKEECLNDKINFIEHVCRQNKISEYQVAKALAVFNDHLKSGGETVKQTKDYRFHFQNWLKKQDLKAFRLNPQGVNTTVDVMKNLGL
jgi:hypothetical protein